MMCFEPIFNRLTNRVTTPDYRAVMRDALTRDYTAMTGMIFGEVPELDVILQNTGRLEQILNSRE
jgi:hypothetical protein